MAKTPEQTEADNALEAAVKQVVAAYNLIPPQSIVTDYFIVGEATEFLDDDDATCEMFLAFRNGHCRLTTAIGMFHLGRKRLIEQWTGDGEE